MTRYPRIPPRLDWIFPAHPVFFVTFCVHRRRPVLNTAGVQSVFESFAISAYRDRDIAVGRYVIMPDHVHLFVCGPHDFVLGPWVGLLKQILAKEIAGRGIRRPIWQRGFFDHVLRNDESYSQKWEYVLNNPVRAGLVARPEEWPYAGEIVAIDRA